MFKALNELKNNIREGKICYVMDLGNYLGGAGNHLLRHAKLSQQSGINVVICIPADSKGMNEIVEQICIREGLEYYFIDYCTSYNFSSLSLHKVPQAINEFINLAQKKNIKLFHSVQLNPAVELASRILDIPHIMSIYQIDKYEFHIEYPDIFPKFVHSDSILYSNVWKEGLNSTTICIRVWIPDMFYKNKSLTTIKDKKTLTLIISGTVCERKSQNKVIQAVGNLNNKGIDIKLNILGYALEEDPYVKESFEFIKKYNIEDQVCIKGFSNDILQEMKNADALVCASNDESFPQVILEAMAMNIPVISTPVAGVPELLENNVNSYVSNDFSVESIQETIETFIYDYNNNPKKVIEIVENAFQLVSMECSEKNVLEKLFGFYNKILCNPYEYNLIQKNIYQVNSDLISCIKKVENILNEKLNKEQLKLIVQNEFVIYCKIKHLSNKYTNANCLIWGASNGGYITLKIIENLLNNFNIIGFVDKFKEGFFEDKIIYKPDELKEIKFDFVFIATEPGKLEVTNFLNDIGLKNNLNYTSFLF